MIKMRISDIAEQIVMHTFTNGTGRRQKEGSDGGRDAQAIYLNFYVSLSNYDLEENRFNIPPLVVCICSIISCGAEVLSRSSPPFLLLLSIV
jgi:hypothetical protein